jgi:hypothetical protein
MIAGSMSEDLIHLSENDLQNGEEDLIRLTEQDLEAVEQRNGSQIVLGAEDVLSSSTAIDSGSNDNEIICPYDHQPIKVGQEVISCTRCNTPHHSVCWRENKGCSVHKCHGKHSKPFVINQSHRIVEEISLSPDLKQTNLGNANQGSHGILNMIREILERLT